jgi:hypothetical protein
MCHLGRVSKPDSQLGEDRRGDKEGSGMRTKHDERPVRRVWSRLGLLFLAATTLNGSIWALPLPRSFYAYFPLPGRDWVSTLGPCDEHLVRDYGALTWPSASCCGDGDLPGAAYDPGRARCLAWLRGTALHLPHNTDRTFLTLRQRGATEIFGVTGSALAGLALLVGAPRRESGRRQASSSERKGGMILPQSEQRLAIVAGVGNWLIDLATKGPAYAWCRVVGKLRCSQVRRIVRR